MKLFLFKYGFELTHGSKDSMLFQNKLKGNLEGIHNIGTENLEK
jgi:hypothetical protein